MSVINTRLCMLPFSISAMRPLVESNHFLQIRNFAARKGTRERKSKKKVKVVVEKIGFIPHNLRDKDKILASRPSRKFDDSWKQTPLDDVYIAKYYKWKVYPFEEAVHAHRETHHPEVYNKPNAPLHVSIELNMQGEKQNKFTESFSRLCGIQHKFHHGEERSILAFTKDSDMQLRASAAGAELAGGVELIKKIQNGEVALQNFQFILAHPNILPELVSLRGLMKKKFPSAKAGTLDSNTDEAVTKFMCGINYRAVRDEYEKDFGVVETVIGTLNMDVKHLEANFALLLKDINSVKSRKSGGFIRRALLKSPPSGEIFKVDHNLYLGAQDEQEDENDDDNIQQRVVL